MINRIVKVLREEQQSLDDVDGSQPLTQSFDDVDRHVHHAGNDTGVLDDENTHRDSPSHETEDLFASTQEKEPVKEITTADIPRKSNQQNKTNNIQTADNKITQQKSNNKMKPISSKSTPEHKKTPKRKSNGSVGSTPSKKGRTGGNRKSGDGKVRWEEDETEDFFQAVLVNSYL